MTIKTDRLKESIYIIASQEMLHYSREYEHEHGIITILDVVISPDKSYADLQVHGQSDDKELTQFLTPITSRIHTRISRELWLRKTPKIRFRVAKKTQEKKDILTIIQELDAQYGLSR